MIFRALTVWFLMMIVAILNGIARNSLITPHLGEHAGHVISTITLCALILLLTRMTISWVNPGSKKVAIGVGLFWFSLTVAFEFGAGHFIFGHSWEKLFADYDFIGGRIWMLVLVTTFFAPILVERSREG